MTAIDRLPPTPANQLRLWMLAAAAQVTAHLVAIGGTEELERFTFLLSYLEEAQSDRPPDTPAAVAQAALEDVIAWEARLPPDANVWPLRRLEAEGLTPAHLLALALAGLVEDDARFGALYAALQPSSEERLTVGLLSDCLRATASDADRLGWHTARSLLGSGLLATADQERPRASWPLRVPAAVWDALRGELSTQPAPGLRYLSPESFPDLAALAARLPGALSERLIRIPEMLSGHLEGLVLRGMQGSGRVECAGSIARALGRGSMLRERADAASLAPQLAVMAPLCMLYGALPVIDVELEAGENLTPPPLPGYDGPRIYILGREGTLHGPSADRCATILLPAHETAERRTQWLTSLSGRADEGTLDQLSASYHLTPGGIQRAGRLALAYATLDGRETVSAADVQDANRAINNETLESLATRVETDSTPEDLVVSDATQAELTNFLMRCRQRESVLGRLGRGFGASTNRGVRALFSGSSGTGKTLAARILAGKLGLDLYRIDLSAVVNKYIGETERNLARVFARAEEQDVILLLDEGDSLLTGRTDVRTSNDRYANMETNYLLQRLESYEGILVVTTNALGRIDKAFQRRIDVHVEFTSPDSSQRYRIWQLHLPPDHAVPEWYLGAAATKCTLSGGQIRNAALQATFLAVNDERPLDGEHLAAAIAREYRKMGASSPLAMAP